MESPVSEPVRVRVVPEGAMWWWSRNDESFNGPCDTREAAIKEGRDSDPADGFYICQATQHASVNLSDYFDATDFIERANEDSAELMGEDGDPLFDQSEDQVADLQAMVCAAIDIWQEKRGLAFIPWCFDWQGPSEWISTKPDEEGSAE